MTTPKYEVDYGVNWFLAISWSSLVEGDKQLDQSNSQTCMEWCHASSAYFWGVCHKHSSFLLGPIQPSSPTTKELHAYIKLTSFDAEFKIAESFGVLLPLDVDGGLLARVELGVADATVVRQIGAWSEIEVKTWAAISVAGFGEFLPLWGNIQKSWAILGLIYYLVKFWTYFGKFCMPLGKFLLM